VSYSATDPLVRAIVEGVLAGMPEPGAVRPRLLNVTDAARYLGRTGATLRQLIRKGKLPTVSLDGRVFLDIQDLDRAIDEAKTIRA
jgi:excisionase family DNA binding protein